MLTLQAINQWRKRVLAYRKQEHFHAVEFCIPRSWNYYLAPRNGRSYPNKNDITRFQYH